MNRLLLIPTLICPLLLLPAGCGGDADESADSGTLHPSQPTNELAQADNAPIAEMPEAPHIAPSVNASNVLRMVQSGMDEIVIRNQIFLFRGAYNLSPEELAWLTEHGVSQNILSTILQRDRQLQATVRQSESVRTQALAREQAELSLRQELTELRLRRELESARQALAQRPDAPPKAEPGWPDQLADLPAQVRPFHQALKPYGSWLKSRQHGLVWRPTISRERSAWRPYGDNGRWLSTEQGWYWHSEYPWGWAAFHYGRWGFDRKVGWYWVPDTVWGPSWVTFRMNGEYVGWAPLPPGAVAVPNLGVTFGGRPVGTGFNYGLSSAYYSFVPTAHVFYSSLSTFLLARSLVPNCYRRTTVINNIVIGNIVINHGIPISRLVRAALRPVGLAQIQSLRDYSVEQFGSIVRTGDRTTVFRPSLAHIAPVKPASIRIGGTNVTVLVPKAAPDNVVIAGEPVVDHSTGVPVVTGYRNPSSRRYPVYLLPVGVNQSTTAGSPAASGRVNGQSPFGLNYSGSSRSLSSPGFTPAMPLSPPQPIMSTPQILGPPIPISPTAYSPGFNTVTNPATGQKHYQYVPGSEQSHWYNRR